MKKSSSIVIIISIILVVCIVGVFSYTNNQKKVAEQEKIVKEQTVAEENLQKEISERLEDMEVTPIIDGENKEIATGSGEIKVWEETKDKETKSPFDLIKEERITILTFSNVKQCSDLMYLKKECESKFLYSLAVSSENLSYCNKLSSRKEINNCKDDINYKNNNCSSIINTYLKSKCEYNSKDLQETKVDNTIISNSNTYYDANKCKGLETYIDKENCIKNVIINTKKIDLCLSFFTKDEEKNTCYKNVSYDYNRAIINEAFQKKNLTLCESLTTTELKTQCKSMKF